MGFIKALIGLPLAFIVMVFAFVNNDMATFSLWPTGIEITVSLSVAIVFFVVVGYIIGWMFTWLSYASVRRALRSEKKQNKKLSKEQEKLVREVEGLQGDIESLKTTTPTEEKTSWKEKIKRAFLPRKDSEMRS
jgi:uncharacterized integral membrane protein